jgi:hypothetical protein
LNASVTKLKTSPSEGVETEKTAFERECVASFRDLSRRPHDWQARPAETWSRFWRTQTAAHG